MQKLGSYGVYWYRPLLLPSLLSLAFVAFAFCEAQEKFSLAPLSKVIRLQFPQVKSLTTRELLEVQASGESMTLLDTRSEDEFAVSHLLSARWMDPTTSDPAAALKGISRTSPIIAYCSVGYRSALVIDRLRKSGFTNLRNLDQGIFGWGNNGLPMVDSNGHATKVVHPYNLVWGQYLDRSLWSKKPE